MNHQAGWRIGAEAGEKGSKRKRGIRKGIQKRAERSRQVSRKGLGQEGTDTPRERGREREDRKGRGGLPKSAQRTRVGQVNGYPVTHLDTAPITPALSQQVWSQDQRQLNLTQER